MTYLTSMKLPIEDVKPRSSLSKEESKYAEFHKKSRSASRTSNPAQEQYCAKDEPDGKIKFQSKSKFPIQTDMQCITTTRRTSRMNSLSTP
eukprot:4828069-Pleurochrysis_carterae.AAC.3